MFISTFISGLYPKEKSHTFLTYFSQKWMFPCHSMTIASSCFPFAYTIHKIDLSATYVIHIYNVIEKSIWKNMCAFQILKSVFYFQWSTWLKLRMCAHMWGEGCVWGGVCGPMHFWHTVSWESANAYCHFCIGICNRS